ncbi:manganese efflux pump [Candidatus Woesebacteria bacterium]|nr:manganese efflux pump [Candidatus Woesebacteria bacterium]
MFETVLVALSLAMDSFSSSVVCGSLIKAKKDIKRFTIPLSLGLFHILTPLLGWRLGSIFETLISSVDHWIAFLLLNFVGIKMIYGSVNFSPSKREKLLNGSNILALSVATSIDAFVVGISFAFLDTNIFKASITIGIVTYLLSILGIMIGRKIKGLFGQKAGVFGGIVLIGLGIKILIEHIFL